MDCRWRFFLSYSDLHTGVYTLNNTKMILKKNKKKNVSTGHLKLSSQCRFYEEYGTCRGGGKKEGTNLHDRTSLHLIHEVDYFPSYRNLEPHTPSTGGDPSAWVHPWDCVCD